MFFKHKNQKFPKRLSVDVSLSTQGAFFDNLKRQSMQLEGQLLPRHLPPIVSQTNLSLDDGRQLFTKKMSQIDTQKQIKTIFERISTRDGKITIQILQNCLMQLGEDPKYAFDMIQMLDNQNNGYVQQDAFTKYFMKKQSFEQKVSVPERMQKKAQIVKFISENNKLLKPLENEGTCQRVMRQFTNIMLSQKQNQQ